MHAVGPPRLARPPRPGPCLDCGFSICSYKKQPVKNIWGRILGLARLKFAVAALMLCWKCLMQRAYAGTFDLSSSVPDGELATLHCKVSKVHSFLKSFCTSMNGLYDVFKRILLSWKSFHLHGISFRTNIIQCLHRNSLWIYCVNF